MSGLKVFRNIPVHIVEDHPEAGSDVDVRLVVLKDHIRSGQSIYLHHQGILYRNLPAVREFNLFDEDHQFWQHIWDHVRCSSEMLRTFTVGRS